MIEFAWPVRVYYEDTDLGGVVYYANYLKFMERARTEWLRNLGFEQDELKDRFDVIFVVKSVELDYLQPARFNDELLVSVKPIKVRGASLLVEQEIIKQNEKGILCKGMIKIVSLTASNFTPCPIPGAIMQKAQHKE